MFITYGVCCAHQYCTLINRPIYQITIKYSQNEKCIMLNYHIIFKLSNIMFENVMRRNTNFIILYFMRITLNTNAELS